MNVERVIFVSISEALGGGERCLLATAAAAAPSVAVAVAGAPGTPVLAEASRLGLPVIELPVGRKLGRGTALTDLARYPLARRRLRAFLERGRPGEWTLFQYKWEELLWAGEVAPERVALWEHGPIPRPLLRLPVARARLRRAFDMAAAVFAWSLPARDSIIGLTGRSPEMLAAGVDPSRAALAMPRRTAVRAGHGASAEEPLLAFAGRLTDDKGVSDLIRALPMIERGRALICGEGPARAPLEALAERLRVSDRVRFLGFVADPLPQLAAADVTVLLSRSPGEGRPLVAVESAAVGTPVLGLAGFPALDALAAEGVAHLVARADPATVSRGVEALMRLPRRPLATPSWEDTAERFLDVLKSRS